MVPPQNASEVDEWWQLAVEGGPRLGSARTRAAGWQLTAAEIEAELGSLGRLATGRGFVLNRAELADAGVDDATRRRMLRHGRWYAPRYGFVCVLPTRDDGRPSATDREIAIVAATRSRHGTLASQESAATLHGLTTLHRPTRTRLTSQSPSAGGGWPDVLVNVVGVGEDERCSWFGVPVTSVARTVIDIARRSGVPAGLVTADAALREELTMEADLHRSLRAARGRPGAPDAVRVVELARPASESALESLTRLCLLDGGFSQPLVLQAPIRTDRGTYRVDLLVADHRVIIEADGALKYRDDPRALWREKLRQEALERAGYRIVRVTWADVRTAPLDVLARVRAACAQPARSAF